MPDPVRKASCEPRVSILIPAYNEERVIGAKIENCLGLDYPEEKLEIVVASDGSTDSTCAEVKKYSGRGVVLLDYPRNQGKFRVINQSVPRTTGDIVVFSDASGMLNAKALREVVSNFHDPRVGCVSAFYRMIPENDSLDSKGYRTYLEYDIGIKRAESLFHTIIGAHGAFYAIRRELFEPVPEYLINDDFYVPMKVVEKGYRAVYEEGAVVTDRMRYSLRDEFRRRVRIGFGNWQQIVELKNLLSPSRGRVAWQFFSHKVLRTAMTFFIVTSFLASSMIPGTIYRVYFLACVLVLVLAAAGGALRLLNVSGAFLSMPYFLVVGNAAYLVGAVKFLCGHRKVKW